MRILIAAIGRFRRGPERDLYDTYVKRARWSIQLKELDVKGKMTGLECQKQEANLLLGAVPEGATVVALDERGKAISSETLAKKMSAWQSQGQSSFVFLIGGADGLDDSVRDRADLLLPFGSVTWPHLLVRAMLAEQLYRVESILAGHPYHRNG